MNIFFILLVAVSLSMDAFSLALSIGTMGLSNKNKITLALTVGLFHFFMPLLGSLIGFLFISAVHIDTNIIEAVIFFYISIFMFKDYKSDERTEFSISLIGYIFFALGVSLDSFGVGFALSKKILASLIDSTVFSIVSASFTFLGLEFGGVLSDIIGKKSVLIGAFGMFFLGLYNFCQFMF